MPVIHAVFLKLVIHFSGGKKEVFEVIRVSILVADR